MHPLASHKGPFLVLAGAICFGTIGFTQAITAADGATPLLIAGARMFIGGFSLLILLLIKKQCPSLKGWPIRNVILSVAGILGYQYFFLTGTLYAGVAICTVVTTGSTPIIAAIMALLFLQEKPIRAWYPATILAIVGLIIINGLDDGLTSIQALFYPLAAGTSYSIYLTFSKPLVQNNRPEAVIMVLMLLCGLCLLPLLCMTDISWLFTAKGMLASAHLGIIATAAGYSLTLAGLKLTPTSTAATLGLAEPVAALLLGLCFLNENLSLHSWLGIACILSSVLLLILLPRFRPFH